MTALAGFWSFAGDPAASSNCARILKAQEIYGTHSAQWDGGGISLGRRLFPILPEDRFDRHPQVSVDRDRVLVADVRIDNRSEATAALGIDRSSAATQSDADLLMRALDRWGRDAVQHVVGDFAFVLWDGRERRLTLGRDHLGNRPLHFHRGRNFIAFASLPKGLHALAEVPRAVNRRKVLEFVALMPEVGPETYFEEIERVEPGHLVTIDERETASRRWWIPSQNALKLASHGDYVDAVRECLDRAVADRLRIFDHGKIGSHLSAGLDSSAVTTAAARLLPTPCRLTAFTAVPRDDFDGFVPRNRLGNEGPIAAETAALYDNVDHVSLDWTGRPPFDCPETYFRLTDRPPPNPFANSWGFAINDEAKARGINVMLTAQAGNMSFSFDGRTLLPNLAAKGRLGRLAREMSWMRRTGHSLRQIVQYTFAPIAPVALWKVVQRIAGRSAALEDHSAINGAAVRSERLSRAAADRRHDFSYRPWRESRAMREWVLSRADSGSFLKAMIGGWGIDYRDPMGDRRLVELCLSIPDEQFHWRGEPRAIARHMLAGNVPDLLLRNRRDGLQCSDWQIGLGEARNRIAADVERLLETPGAEEILDLPRLRSLVAEWPTSEITDDRNRALYRLALPRALAVGEFLRRASGSNA